MTPVDAPPRPSEVDEQQTEDQFDDDGLGTALPGEGEHGEEPGTPPVDDAPPADLPDDGTGDEDDVDEEPGLVMDGNHPQLSLTIGGEKPTSSALKLQGGKLELEGEFRKGDRLRVVLDLRVGAVKVEDTMDTKTGEVKAVKRTQWARIEGVQRVDSSEE